MTSIKQVAQAGLCALALVGITSTAHAGLLPALGDSVYVATETETTGDTATISFSGLPGGASSLNVYTAPVLLSGTFGAANTVFSDLLAYCTDLYNYSSSPTAYAVGSLVSSNQPSGTDDLTVEQLNDIASLINNVSHTDQAATQLAIWSVEYGTAFTFSNASGTTGADAAAYLAALDGTAPSGVTLYQLQSYTSPTVQGFAFVDPVPEPASMALLGVGTIGVGVVARRRRRSAATMA